MQSYLIPYGTKELAVSFEDNIRVDLIVPEDIAPVTDPQKEIAAALIQPRGTKPIRDYMGVKTVAIAINDKTRPVPHELLLPPILEELEKCGVTDENITLIIATGTHLPIEKNEFYKIVPDEIQKKYRIISHDCKSQDMINLGITSRGTPVSVNRSFFEADLKITIGNVEPHHFMGFSGGAKTASIGLTGWETINTNHAMMLHPKAHLGQYDDNPMRMDVEEIGQMIGVDFCLNVILNENKKIIRAYAGSPLGVMKASIPMVRQLFEVKIPEQYDLVIASPGGHPRDINFYQAEKALSEAALITRDGGTVILVAACPEGSGSKSYEQWMDGTTSYEAVFERFKREPFRIGPHKAYQVARDASRVRVILVSEISSDLVRKMLLTPCNTMDQALDIAWVNIGADPKVAVLPMANTMMPVFN